MGKINVNLNGSLFEAMQYYMAPTSTIKDHPKDYEVVSALNMHEKPPDYWMPDEPYQYKATNAQVFEDPGHNKEEIYSWFQEKKFQKLERDDIRCVRFMLNKNSLRLLKKGAK